HFTAKNTAPICSWEVPGDGADGVWTTRVSEESDMAANTDAMGIGGIVSYVLLAYVNDGDPPISRYPWKVTATIDTDDVNLQGEQADMSGFLAQTHRHLENVHRMSIGLSTQTMSAMQQENQSLRQRILELESKNMEVLQMYEQLISLRHEREIAAADSMAKIRQRDEIVSMLRIITPAMVNRITGKKILPETSPLALTL